ncbi:MULTISPECIES: hypothetical protein [unclassified Pseudomonas]|uniref:hypothetical protein n=1 Tax=unclassified Pseudomonas TaxID=196821 RepID=UPI002AC97BC9|nr:MULTISPECIES: hypothetical protein [unclassified Pseudomonas]MEB0045008.1 hypothetical protein [Pseudomonas sp. Dout3]MEB0095980.1 hypothetical protein [Pseudomonas sp. DC1.2]WPX57846.1 hypothetical protein RHM68_19850 [Pseudomonas sp. DC1.2]
MNSGTYLSKDQDVSIATYARSAIEIPGAITPVDAADVGVNLALLRANRGLPIIISPDAIKPGDTVLVYIDNRLIHVLVVADNYDGLAITLSIPSNLVPEGIFVLRYRVNIQTSAPLTVLVKTRLPGGIDPQPNQPGHHLLAAPSIASKILNGLQDETVTVQPWEGMCRNDVVTLQFADCGLPHTVQANEVGLPITFILPTDRVAANGNGATLLYYKVCDDVGNQASDHSLGQSITIQIGDDKLTTPVVEGMDQQHALYLADLGSRSIQVTLDTSSSRFVAGDSLELIWRSAYRTGELEVVRQVQVLTNSSTLVFTVANAVAQRLAGGCAHLFFNHTDANGVIEQLSFLDFFVVGNTRRVDTPEPGQQDIAQTSGLFNVPEMGILKISAPSVLKSTRPVVGAMCGVSLRIYDDVAPNGVDAYIAALDGAAADDVIDLVLNGTIEATTSILPGGENVSRTMRIPNLKFNSDKVNSLVFTVTRPSNNAETSPPLTILYNAIRPGLVDRDPLVDGHSELELLLPQDIIDNGLDSDRAANGVQVTFRYPYCRAEDKIKFRLNKLDIEFVVTASEAPAAPSSTPASITRLLTREQFVQAVDHPEFSFSYTVIDQITNGPDPRAPYSARVLIDVDLAGIRRAAPVFRENLDDDNDVPEIIELEKLAGQPLHLIIRTDSTRFAINDRIRATYRSPPSADFIVEGTVKGQFGQPFPLVLEVPYNQVISGRLVSATYEQFRGTNPLPIANSRTAKARVIGEALPDLLPPRVLIAPNGILDPNDNPQGATGRVDVILFHPDDSVRLIVQGTPGVGSPLFDPLKLDANGRADFPLTRAFIEANLGQEVNTSYMLIRGTVEKQSPVLLLSVLNPLEEPQITSILAGGINVPPGSSTYYRTGIVISGTATPNQPVDVLDGATPLGRFTTDGSGAWTVPAQSYSASAHTITVRNTSGANKSSIRVFTVLEGLALHIARFSQQDMGGWMWGGAGEHRDLSWIIYPQQGYYHLHNHTYTNHSNGAVLTREFFGLTPGATYLLSSGTFRSDTPFVHPKLQLSTSAGDVSGIYVLSVIYQLVSLQLRFVASAPTMTLNVLNNEPSGVGNDWDFTHIQIERMLLP